MTAAAFLADHATGSRVPLDPEAWRALAEEANTCVAMWADTIDVHALFSDQGRAVIASTRVMDGAFPGLSAAHPPLGWFERMIFDLWGHRATGGAEPRAWLDHGRWAVRHPMAQRPTPFAEAAEPPEFSADIQAAAAQMPLGPVRDLIAVPLHLRLGLAGATVAAAELRLGYAHKGILTLMRGKSPRAAARFAARVSGEATVAHSLAFARAAETALGVTVPVHALGVRDLALDLERLACALADLAAMAASVGSPKADVFAAARESVAQAAATAFGHRLMMDLVVPGGVAADLRPGAAAAIRGAADLAEMALRQRGAWPVVIAEHMTLRAAEGLAIIPRLDAIPDGGPLMIAMPTTSAEGLACVAGPRGSIWHWLRLDSGLIAAAFVCDPGWRAVAELELALRNAALCDVAAIERTVALHPAGIDL